MVHGNRIFVSSHPAGQHVLLTDAGANRKLVPGSMAPDQLPENTVCILEQCSALVAHSQTQTSKLQEADLHSPLASAGRRPCSQDCFPLPKEGLLQGKESPLRARI